MRIPPTSHALHLEGRLAQQYRSYDYHKRQRGHVIHQWIAAGVRARHVNHLRHIVKADRNIGLDDPRLGSTQLTRFGRTFSFAGYTSPPCTNRQNLLATLRRHEIAYRTNSVRSIRPSLRYYRGGMRDTARRIAGLEQQIAMERLKHPAVEATIIDTSYLRPMLLQHPLVSDATVEDTGDNLCIAVQLRDIELHHGRTREPLGRFVHTPLLTVRSNAATSQVSTTMTLTGPTEIKALGSNFLVHPHWLRGQSPCYGDFAQPVADAIAQHDFGTLCLLLIEFLRHVDPADTAGRYYENWPTTPTTAQANDAQAPDAQAPTAQVHPNYAA